MEGGCGGAGGGGGGGRPHVLVRVCAHGTFLGEGEGGEGRGVRESGATPELPPIHLPLAPFFPA